MKTRPSHLSLARRFTLLSLPILLAAILAVGWWVGQEVRSSALRRQGGVTALYVDSFIAPHVQVLQSAADLDDASRRSLRQVVERSALRERVLALKVWRPDGTVLFSSDGRGEGQRHAIDHGLTAALGGDIWSHISVRSAAERQAHGQPDRSRVIETYTPLRALGGATVLAVAESYQDTHELDGEARRAQWRSWAVVAALMGTMYALLLAVVRGGSRTIESQRTALSAQVAALTALQAQNGQLHQRAVQAARQAVLVNENQLRRVAADVHDGPVQDLGLALMMLDAGPDPAAAPGSCTPRQDWGRVRAAVQSALTDLRAICANLDLPDIDDRTLGEVAARALRDFQAKTGRTVPLQTAGQDRSTVPLRVKVTLYRVLQEALANAHRHAGGAPCRVGLRVAASEMVLEVRDEGPGLVDDAPIQGSGHRGLRGMRHRVDLLQGQLEIEAAAGGGTWIRATLPLPVGGDDALASTGGAVDG